MGSRGTDRRPGGASRDRTGDPLLAKQVLSQLSYGPLVQIVSPGMVGLGRVELPTSPLSGVRSNQLSYRPGYLARLQVSLADIKTGNLNGDSHRADARAVF